MFAMTSWDLVWYVGLPVAAAGVGVWAVVSVVTGRAAKEWADSVRTQTSPTPPTDA